MPIFDYRCERGHRFERLVGWNVAAPACPECGGATRKLPPGARLGRGSGTPSPGSTGQGGAGRGRAPGRDSVPIPWRGVVEGGPEKLKREVEFRERLEAEAVGAERVSGGPDLPHLESGGGT